MIDTTAQLLRGVELGWLPLNVHCPNKCAFCFETRIEKLLPEVQKLYIPRYNKERFDLYMKASKSIWGSEKPSKKRRVCSFAKIGNQICYLSTCDFFSVGLSSQQIETLIQYGIISTVYTTGLNVDIDFLRYLSRKYRHKFNVFLSIVTFDPILRGRLMNASIDFDKIIRICDVLASPTYMFMYFNKNQTISDIEIINDYSVKNNGTIYISKLYYNRLDPVYLVNLANNAEEEFKSIVYYLKTFDDKLKNISKRLSFSPKPEIYAYRWRKQIIELLQVCDGVGTEALFCSQGAYTVIKNYFKDYEINIVPLKNCFGGCVDLSVGITVNSVLKAIEELLATGIKLKQIYIPNTFFLIDYKYDFEGNAIENIRKIYSNIEVTVIDIPPDINRSVLTLDECIDYFENINSS